MEKINFSNETERYASILDMIFKCIKGTDPIPDAETCNNYVQMFSFFLYHSDSDYVYNIPFLKEAHDSFRKFLENSRKQYILLEKIVTELSAILPKNKSASETNKQLMDMVLSLNSFLQIGYNNDFVITLCDPPSFSGGNRTESNYVYTLYNGNNARCFYQKQYSDMITYAKSIIESSMTYSTEGKETK